MKTASPDRSGVMLIGHGTRDQQGTDEFFQLGEILTKLLSPTPVVACLLEFQEPTIPQAWQTLVEQGVEHIHVAPLLLFAAGHAKQDIPALIQKCQSSTPTISFDQSRPISRHLDLVKLVQQRIQEQLDANIQPDETALLMVGRGSHDPCASADMKVLTEVIRRRFDFVKTRTAYYAMAQPALKEVLIEMAQDSSTKTVIVQPHLLFHGRLYEAIGRIVSEVAAEYSNKKFVLSSYLGPNIHIANSIAARTFSSR